MEGVKERGKERERAGGRGRKEERNEDGYSSLNSVHFMRILSLAFSDHNCFIIKSPSISLKRIKIFILTQKIYVDN
jgi:hypothetical protein